MSVVPLEEDFKRLVEELKNYKAGDILRREFGDNAFDAAIGKEMETMAIRIGLFGFTGAGKSSFVNSLNKCFFQDDIGHEDALLQPEGREGSVFLEAFFNDFGFRLLDTRGFMSIENVEERELLTILFGAVPEGDMIERGNDKPLSPDTFDKMSKYPLSQQIHVVLWFVKATDARLHKQIHVQKTKFVSSYLKKIGVTVMPIITFTDLMEPESRPTVIEQIKGMWSMSIPIFITNYLHEEPEKFDTASKLEILTIIKDALEYGEISLRARQTKR